MSSTYQYWYIILFLFLEYAFAICVYRHVVLKEKEKSNDPVKYLVESDLHTVSTSWLGGNATIALTVFRIICFFWFLIAGAGLTFSLHPTSWHFFTQWNVCLITFFFLLASVASLLHVLKLDTSKYLSEKTLSILNFSLSLLFEIVGASAIFVTCVDLSFLSADPSLLNMVLHVSTSCSQLVELSLNNISVDAHHFLFALGWPQLYLIFITIIVTTGIRGWPYDFLRTDTPNCFIWYHLMLLLFVIFYAVWCALFKAKVAIARAIHVDIEVDHDMLFFSASEDSRKLLLECEANDNKDTLVL